MTNIPSIAERLADSRYDAIALYDGKVNPYTGLVHWPDGSISKIVSEQDGHTKLMTRRILKFHDIGIFNRMNND